MRKNLKMNMRQIILCFCLLSLFFPCAAWSADGHPVVRLETNRGNITLELYEDRAPITVTNFLLYTALGFYDGADGNGSTVFHRVIDNFMIQGGGFSTAFYDNPSNPWLGRKSNLLASIPNEADNGLSNDAYTIAMARTTAPHSATSQFFVNVEDNAFLNHKDKTSDSNWGYAVFGKVISGTETVDAIKGVSTTNTVYQGFENVPDEAVVITKAAIENLGSFAGLAPKIWFPLVLSTGDIWETEICLINTGSADTWGTLQAFGLDGKALSDIIVQILPPNGRKEIRVSELFPETVGYIVFSSPDNAVSGCFKISAGEEYRLAAPAAKDNAAEMLHIPLLLSKPDWWTVISLVNTSSEIRNVEIAFNDGTVRTRSIGPGNLDIFMVRDLFDGEAPADLLSASIKNTSGIIGFQAMGSTGTKCLTGNLLTGNTASKQYFARTVSDANWFDLGVTYNPSESACEFRIKSSSANGTALMTNKAAVQGMGAYPGIFSSGDIPENAAWIEVESVNPDTGESCPVSGTGFFGSLDGNLLSGYTSAGMVGKSGLLPKLEKEGYTAAVFVNIGFTRAKVNLTAYDDGGNVIAESQLSLNARNSAFNLMAGFFDTDISGASYVRYAADKNVAAFQANLSGNSRMLDAMNLVIE
ncbi:MAG: peptidylprolyl isomerase [Desulfobacterales bacterium]